MIKNKLKTIIVICNMITEETLGLSLKVLRYFLSSDFSNSESFTLLPFSKATT